VRLLVEGAKAVAEPAAMARRAAVNFIVSCCVLNDPMNLNCDKNSAKWISIEHKI
jgi:hypothetical protein